ncbi:unnamed protein product [Somion occarium]|uniref:Uncharacterized protein n=1 Tax=Somion occarium TaxID=3059160 RepID=A0ABP1CS23_9APHY
MASEATENKATAVVADANKPQVVAAADGVKAEDAVVKQDSVAGSSSDVVMDDDEKSKMLRATRQLEFYFADANLPYDKFMWTLHTANPEHWVPISTVASFKRMREFSPLGLDWVANALKTISTELEIDETNTKVRRKTEVTEPKGQFERSIYAKGFGEEVPGLQRKLEEFFNQYGRTNAVRMRREEETKQFKGSVFVEFDSASTVEKFLNADPKPSWNGQELLIMTKEAYCEMKIKEKGITGKNAVLRKQNMAGGRGFNAFKEMAAQKSGSRDKDNKPKDRPKPEVWLEFLGNRIRVYDEDGGTIKPDELPFVKGASLKFEGVEGDVSFDEVKGPLKERYTRAPFVKYNKGDTWGLVGFDRALSEEDIAYVKENIKILGSKEVTWTIPDEETEKAFQTERATGAAKRVMGFANKSEQGSRGGRGGRGGRGRGGRGRGRGGRGGRGGRDSRAGDSTSADATKNDDTQAGDKRKRAVEPDGGPDVGVRNQSIPLVQSAKKTKVEGGAGDS